MAGIPSQETLAQNHERPQCVTSCPDRLDDVAGWWNSIAAMRRLSRALVVISIGNVLVGVTTWPRTLALAVPAFVLATGPVLCGLFTGFLLDPLRELARLGRAVVS